MSDCSSCQYDHLCVYEYKPCDCVNQRKFRPADNIVACSDCNSQGYNPFPIQCRKCRGSGHVIEQTTP